MAIYDINGYEIAYGGEVTTAQVKSALVAAVASGDVNLGSPIGATLSYTSPGAAWEANAAEAYGKLLTAYREIPNSGIPFFLCTDQHGMGVEAHRWMNNADTDGMEVLNLNLGDTVADVFSVEAMNLILSRTRQVKRFLSVVGNHELKQGPEVPNSFDVNRTFRNTMEGVKAVSPLNCCSVLDPAHSCRVLVVDTNVFDGGLRQGLTTAAADWVIRELSREDGMDILWLNHWPLFDSCKQRGDAEETGEGLNTISGSTAVQFAIWQMLIDRKNRAAGTYTDIDGVAHAYDFSGCEGNLLCCLHGHIHTEWYSVARGLTGYAATAYCYNTYSCTFGLIDRLNGKVTFWVFDTDGCKEPLELPIS